MPNLIKKRFWLQEEERWVTLKVSAAGMRTIEKRGLDSVVRNLRAQGQKI
jgi:large subunit ribosomal protein L28